MKMLMLVYNEALDNEIMEILESCAVKNYTKTEGVFGCGTTSGTHLGTDVWPGRNNMLYVACEEAVGKKIIALVKQARQSLGKEGLKAFLLPLEDLT